LVVALIGLLLPVGLGVLARRRKRRADRRDREIEAELQEIVAEERARQSAWR
jgi:hypothetical protein